MYKIGQLSERFKISRSALLYYDSINLLKPSCRTKANYRLYSEDDVKRLELICMYRDMGIELKDIKDLIDDKTNDTEILEIALMKLENNIKIIRNKQNKIIEAMQKTDDKKKQGREIFTDILRSIGLTEENMIDFHVKYEKNDAKGHKAFLEFLGLSEDEIITMKEKITN